MWPGRGSPWEKGEDLQNQEEEEPEEEEAATMGSSWGGVGWGGAWHTEEGGKAKAEGRDELSVLGASPKGQFSRHQMRGAREQWQGRRTLRESQL